MAEAPKKLQCYLDGNALCIVGLDFINLQESEAMFITLTEAQIAEFNALI
jgi:hypothetical protein